MLSLVVVACSSSNPSEDQSHKNGVVEIDSGSTTDTSIPDLNCETVTERNALFIFEDIDDMVLLTPLTGGGIKPLFSWEPVDRAESYGMVLFGPEGDPYWAWQGYETKIYLGGLTDTPDLGSIGQILSGCMSWITTAYSAEGIPIAAGGFRSISP